MKTKYNTFEEYLNDNFIHYNGRETDDFESDFDDMLNGSHEAFNICGVTIQPADIAKECDPIAYRQGLLDYIDGLVKDGEWIEEKDCYYSPEEHQRATDDWDDSNSDDEEDETDFQYRLVREGNLK